MKAFIVTGPEASGKSTLSSELGNHFQVPVVGEYARYYLNSLDRDYSEADVHSIAKCQSRNWWQYVHTQHPFIIVDTWYVVIAVWLYYKYEKIPPWVTGSIRMWQKDTHYLLCAPDIPWTPDPLRENPHDRDLLYALYLDFLGKYTLDYSVIRGKERKKEGVRVVNSVMH